MALNHWIRTSGAFDGVVDVDQVLRDPSHPTRLLPAYDSGDHLHPNTTVDGLSRTRSICACFANAELPATRPWVPDRRTSSVLVPAAVEGLFQAHRVAGPRVGEPGIQQRSLIHAGL